MGLRSSDVQLLLKNVAVHVCEHSCADIIRKQNKLRYRTSLSLYEKSQEILSNDVRIPIKRIESINYHFYHLIQIIKGNPAKVNSIVQIVFG
jgi:hypothetical protein